MELRVLLSIIFLLFLCICSGTGPLSSDPAEEYASNRSFVFVSGFPQSGTSLVQQMLTVSPYFSTQVAKCFEVHGTKCANWNSEGQWLLRRDSVFDRAFKPGKMCPVDESLFQDPLLFSASKQKLHVQWGQYWDLKDTLAPPLQMHHNSGKILVEKSPHNMVKIPFLAEVFQGSRSLRFIIVIKHPVTLNIALPRGNQWMSQVPPSANAADSKNNARRFPQKVPWNATDLIGGFEHFINFMTANSSTGPDCNLGWLSTLEELLKNTKGKLSLNVTIVKYEDFAKPVDTCQSIMKFATSGEGIEKIENFERFCRKNFSPKIRASKMVKNPTYTLAQYKERNSQISGQNRLSRRYRFQRKRKLRLKAASRKDGGVTMTGIKGRDGYQSLDFDLRMIETSVHSRLDDFRRAYAMLRQLMKTKDIILWYKIQQIFVTLHDIGTRLAAFGYSLPIDTPKAIPLIESSDNYRKYDIDRTHLGLVNSSDYFAKMRLSFY